MLEAVFKGRWCQNSPGKNHQKYSCSQESFFFFFSLLKGKIIYQEPWVSP